MSVHAAPVTSSTVSLAVDVGKSSFAWSLTNSARVRLLGPVECSMTGPSLRELVSRVSRVLPSEAQVKVGVEAAGHYHRPLLTPTAWPAGWEVLELNPAHVTEQRRVMGRRRVKTDAIDLEAITELLLAGRGVAVTAHEAVLGELAAWSAHRTRRVAVRTAVKNQLLGQLDRAFPGLTLALPDVLGTKIGRLVAAEFTDPVRLAALGTSRLIRFAATRGLQLRRPLAERLVTAARDALPTADAAVARQVLAADLALLADLDAQIAATDRAGPPAAGQPVRHADDRAWLGHRAGRELCGGVGRSGPLARTPPGLPSRRTEPHAVRIRRPPPRRRHQPRGQRAAAPCPDRPRCGAVAQRPGQPPLRRWTADSWQARRHHRLRPGPPSQQDRLRPRSRPRRLRRRPLEHLGGLTDPFTTPAGGATLDPTKGRIRRRIGYGTPR